jgi:hypothetical protein
MPVSTVSPNFDLLNIQRNASVGLFNLTDNGTGFNIELIGNNDNSWVALGSGDANISRTANCSLGGGNYILSGEVDWNGLVIEIPDNALITKVEMLTNLNYDLTASGENAVSSGTANQVISVTDLTAFDPGVEVRAPSTSFIPDTDDSVSETDSENISGSASISTSALLHEAGKILRKIWDFTSEIDGGISKATLITQFTNVDIILRSSRAFVQAQWNTGGIITGTGEADVTFALNTSQWLMSITWESPFQYTLNPPSSSVVEPGQTITITSDPEDPDALLLDELTIEFGGVPIIPTTQTTYLLIFFIPFDYPLTGVLALDAIGNGVQFSGSVALGSLEILITDASGIYVLKPGQAFDKLYASERDGSTRTVKIPDPFIKTGFIGG